MDNLNVAMNAAIILNPKNSLSFDTAKYLIKLYNSWLQGQDLLQTLQLVLGYEVVAGVGFEPTTFRL